MSAKVVLVGADHRGVDLKAKILDFLEENEDKYQSFDMGGIDANNDDDYPDVAFKIAKIVSANPETVFGILICGSGVGVDIVANKIDKVKCALVYDKERAIQSRQHEGVNIIALPSDVLDSEIALEIVKAFLETPFSNEERHIKRLKKISLIEQFGYPVSIIPALLATSEEGYIQEVKKLTPIEFPKIEWVHIDFMDNEFVHNLSITPEVIRDSEYSVAMKKEAHLMVKKPSKWIKSIMPDFSRVIFHVESDEDPDKVISGFRKEWGRHYQIGVAINPETEIEAVYPYLDRIDEVVVMGVHPGKQGQEFIPDVLEKIRMIKMVKKDMLVGIDGGIGLSNINEVVNAGASNIVIGSHIMEGDAFENIKQFEEKIYFDG